MFSAFLERTVGRAAAEKPKRFARGPQKAQLDTLQRRIQLGQHIAVVLKEQEGDEWWNRYTGALQGTEEGLIKVPRTFWKSFLADELRLN